MVCPAAHTQSSQPVLCWSHLLSSTVGSCTLPRYVQGSPTAVKLFLLEQEGKRKEKKKHNLPQNELLATQPDLLLTAGSRNVPLHTRQLTSSTTAPLPFAHLHFSKVSLFFQALRILIDV